MSADSEGVKHQSDSLVALRNAVKLGGSVILTLGIGFGVRPMMGRYLGLDGFGIVNFADAFTATAFALTALGIDTYIRKEVSVRPEHASDFFGGVTLIRIVLALLLFAGMQVFLMVTHRPPETWLVVHLFGLSAFLLTINQSLAALLHSKGTVNGLSVLNIASKVLWATGTVVTLLLHWPLWCIAMTVVLSESLKTVVSSTLARRELGLRWEVKWSPVKLALVSSAPIFLSVAAHTIYNKLDVSFLAVVAGDKEVAWYTVSSQIAGLALIITPMIGWVLLPLFAKARARSDAEYTQVMRRSLELVLAIAFPTSLFVGLGAEQWVVLMYGETYGPAATSLKVLSSIFVLTYVAILSANALILTGRAWAQAAISISGLAVNPLLNWLLIPWAMARYGEGGAGIGAAMAQLGTEMTVTGIMTALVGARAFDARSLLMIAKTIGVSLVVIFIDAWLQGRMPGLLRIGVDLVAYVALILGVRAIHLQETLDFARAALSRRKKTDEPEVIQRPA